MPTMRDLADLAEKRQAALHAAGMAQNELHEAVKAKIQSLTAAEHKWRAPLIELRRTLEEGHAAWIADAVRPLELFAYEEAQMEAT
jgi:hypothetical protein